MKLRFKFNGEIHTIDTSKKEQVGNRYLYHMEGPNGLKNLLFKNSTLLINFLWRNGYSWEGVSND